LVTQNSIHVKDSSQWKWAYPVKEPKSKKPFIKKLFHIYMRQTTNSARMIYILHKKEMENASEFCNSSWYRMGWQV
jgi:hypothetical protein